MFIRIECILLCMPIPLPSRINSITRTARWISVVNQLPTQLAQHIPKRDPKENKEAIVKQLQLLSDFGVEGADAVETYINGTISETELESRLEESASGTENHSTTVDTLRSKVVLEEI